MFVLVAVCVATAHYQAMPLGISPLWLIPLLFIGLGYYSEKKAALDRAAAIGIVADPQLLAAVAKELPSAYFDGGSGSERGEWLNAALATAWPHVNEARLFET